MLEDLIASTVKIVLGGGLLISIVVISVKTGARRMWALVIRAVEAVEEIPRRMGGMEKSQGRLLTMAETHGEILREVHRKVS